MWIDVSPSAVASNPFRPAAKTHTATAAGYRPIH